MTIFFPKLESESKSIQNWARCPLPHKVQDIIFYINFKVNNRKRWNKGNQNGFPKLESASKSSKLSEKAAPTQIQCQKSTHTTRYFQHLKLLRSRPNVITAVGDALSFFFFFPAKRLRSGIIRRTTSLIVIHSAIAAVIPCYHGIDAIYLYLIVSSIHFVKSGHSWRLESHTPTSAKSLQPTRHLIGRQIAFNFAHRLACKSTHLFSHRFPRQTCAEEPSICSSHPANMWYTAVPYTTVYITFLGLFPRLDCSTTKRAPIPNDTSSESKLSARWLERPFFWHRPYHRSRPWENRPRGVWYA